MTPIVAAADPVIRQKVNALEAMMLTMPQVDMPVRHHFCPQGVYARELHIPAGAILTGKVHKYWQLNIMSKGELSVLTEDGIVRVKAPFTVVSPPGTKRVAFAHEDTVWTTVHATDETDVDKIEAHFVVDTDEEYLAHCETLQIGKD